MTLGEAIDQLYNARAARLALDKEVKELKRIEDEARAVVLGLLNESGLQKASGHLATAGILKSDIPIITDWEPIYGFIKQHNRFDLLQKRIGVVAWRDLYNDGILVPGTEAGVDVDLSLTKSTRS